MKTVDLADTILAAIGAKPGDTIEIVTPTFNRHVSELPPAAPVSTAEWFDALKKIAPDELLALGLRRWTKPADDDAPDAEERWPGEFRLWLFPVEWYTAIPQGYEIVSIMGTREPFERGVTDNDRRFGLLAYGILVSDPA